MSDFSSEESRWGKVHHTAGLNVTENNGKNILQWKTATENNSSHFTVERSGNGQQFKSIGIVNASGFSTLTVTYYFTDTDPLAAINYYRLIMADKDNTKKYSNIISCNFRIA